MDCIWIRYIGTGVGVLYMSGYIGTGVRSVGVLYGIKLVALNGPLSFQYQCHYLYG